MGLFLIIFFTCLIVLKWGKGKGVVGGEEWAGWAMAGGTEHQHRFHALNCPAQPM